MGPLLKGLPGSPKDVALKLSHGRDLEKARPGGEKLSGRMQDTHYNITHCWNILYTIYYILYKYLLYMLYLLYTLPP